MDVIPITLKQFIPGCHWALGRKEVCFGFSIFGTEGRGDVELLCDGTVLLASLDQIYVFPADGNRKNSMTLIQRVTRQ
jgi:hypothetical protein